MLSKLDRLKQACEKLDTLQCPVCGEKLAVADNTLKCANRHLYNLNRKGCVSFLSRPVSSCYDAALFEARSRVFASGAYDGVADALAAFLPASPAALLDAGCGDGWYLDRLLTLRPDCTGAGIDLSRDAILAAACRSAGAVWCVGDLRRMPFADQAFDVVLDILTPADYAAFRRVLKTDGILLKAFPGEQYLREIREARGLPMYQEGLVGEYLQGHGQVIGQTRVTKVQETDERLWRDFVYMTPLNQDLTAQEKDSLPPAKTVTVDLNIAAVRLNG